jgi:hypothetical protein
VWSVKTAAAPAQLLLKPQERSKLTFAVDYRRSELAAGDYVIGSVTITNPNVQVVTSPGLSVTITGAAGGSGAASVTSAQVDCVTGQQQQQQRQQGGSHASGGVRFLVPSSGSVTCR